MHANEYVLSSLSLGHETCLSLSMHWSHASGRKFRMIPGLCTMYEVFSEAFLGFFGGNKGTDSFVFSFQETLENILWEQGSKTNFMGIW